MDKDTYYITLQKLIDRVKVLKNDISNSNDKEQIIYLKLAIESLYIEMRELMEDWFFFWKEGGQG
jgi:hypothetical protein